VTFKLWLILLLLLLLLLVMMMMMMMMMMILQSVYLNDQRSVVMELDKNCNKNTPSLAAALSGLVFTKLGNLQLL